jgi:uncharacterized membrane protein
MDDEDDEVVRERIQDLNKEDTLELDFREDAAVTSEFERDKYGVERSCSGCNAECSTRGVDTMCS